ncbi:MAG: tetratricopeptide repeat protein, partial [Chlorobiaceae bacterium]|nr:tetratricopeptide repeat protein [Chlorobiaceae bacterium]
MKDPAFKLQSAFLLHQEGKLAQAEALYKDVLRLQPANFDALFLLATAAAQQQKFEESLGLFERALKNNPRHPEALNNRGNVLKELKRFEE